MYSISHFFWIWQGTAEPAAQSSGQQAVITDSHENKVMWQRLRMQENMETAQQR